jgi:DNA repair exonuclease SbcCD ATPase subunit
MAEIALSNSHGRGSLTVGRGFIDFFVKFKLMTAKESISQAFEMATCLVDVLKDAATEHIKGIASKQTDGLELERERKTELESAIQAARRRRQDLMEKEEEAKGLVRQIQDALESVKSSADEVENIPPRAELLKRTEELTETLNYLKSRVSLYSTATQVRWNYKQPEVVSGDIVRSSSKVRFEVPRELEEFEAVNLLWRLIDS